MSAGIAAEFGDADALVAAIRAARAVGLTRLEAFGPTPIAAIDDALAAPRSPLAIATGIGALAGAAAAYFLQWLLVAYLYPIDAGMRPPHMPLPFVIITVEMGFLVGGLATFAALFAAARLLRLWDPIFEVPGIESATRDAFWLAVDLRGATWSSDAAATLLRDAGALQVHDLRGAA